MKKWLARALAIVLAGAAIYLLITRVHADPLVLECALGAAILGVLSVALLWKVPVLAASLNAVWIVAALIAPMVIAGLGAQHFATAAIRESPQAAAARLDQVGASMKPEDYVLAVREAQLTSADAAFTYVRDNIGFESYSGILRGADGTFHARAGNALDRAMLLAAILQTNKIPVRLVTGQLPQAQAERLFQRIFEPVVDATASSTATNPAPGSLTDRIVTRARRDYHTIVGALGNNVPAVATPSHDNVIKEIEQHAWVQAQRNGRWVDLDPSFPDSSVGQTYATADRTYDAPPVPLMQQITIRVTTETISGGTLTKDVALETTIPAYQIVDKQVYLVHDPYHPFNGQGGQLQYIFGTKDVMQPALLVPGNRLEGKPIDFGSGASAAGSAPPNSVQAAANAFGTPTPGPANTNATAFVAEWLEFEIAFPDGRKELTRRALIDRAGTAWRHAANHDPSTLHDLARDANGLIAPRTLYNVWFSAGKHNLLAFAAGARELENGTIPSQNPQAPALEEQAWPFAMRNLSWFIASDHIIVPALNDTPGLRFYADSPRIFIWSVGRDPSGKPDSMLVESDLRRDALRGIARDPSEQAMIARHKLWFGALEGALEHELGAPQHPDGSAEFVTTSSLADSGSVVLLTPGSSSSVIDPETQARIQAALTNGDTLIVPKQVLSGGLSGWWEIVRDTGDTRAVLDDDVDGSWLHTPTRGGYNNFKPPSGGGPMMRYNPIKGPIGGPKSWHVPLETEFEPEIHALARGHVGLEPGEEEATSGVIIVTSEPAWLYVAAATADAASLGLLVWECYHPGRLTIDY